MTASIKTATVEPAVARISSAISDDQLRIDDFGRLWVRPSLAAGAEAIASATYTTTTTTAAVSVPDGGSKLNLFIDVTATAGTPTLDIEVEWSPDGGTTWFGAETADVFAQITAATKVAKQFSVLAPTYRLSLTIAGTTPSFTFAVDHVGVYA